MMQYIRHIPARIWRQLVCGLSLIVGLIALFLPRQVAACSNPLDMGCAIRDGANAILYETLRVIAVLGWSLNRGGLILARWIEDLRVWVVELLLTTTFTNLMPTIQIFFLMSLILAAIVFTFSFYVQAFLQLDWVNARRALRPMLFAYILFQVGGNALLTSEQMRLQIGSFLQQQATTAMTSLGSGTTGIPNVPVSGTAEDMQDASVSIYASSAPNRGCAPVRTITARYLSDYTAHYLYATGNDIHCAGIDTLPGGFSGEYFPRPTIRGENEDVQNEAVGMAARGLLRQGTALLLTIGSVIEQVMHFLFGLSLSIAWFGLVISLVFAVWVPTENLFVEQIFRIFRIMRASWVASLIIGILLSIISVVADAGNGILVWFGGLGLLATSVWQVQQAVGLMSTAVGAVAAGVGAGPAAVGGMMKGWTMAAGAVAVAGATGGGKALTTAATQRAVGAVTNAMGQSGGSGASRFATQTVAKRMQDRVDGAFASQKGLRDAQAMTDQGAWYERQFAKTGDVTALEEASRLADAANTRRTQVRQQEEKRRMGRGNAYAFARADTARVQRLAANDATATRRTDLQARMQEVLNPGLAFTKAAEDYAATQENLDGKRFLTQQPSQQARQQRRGAFAYQPVNSAREVFAPAFAQGRGAATTVLAPGQLGVVPLSPAPGQEDYTLPEPVTSATTDLDPFAVAPGQRLPQPVRVRESARYPAGTGRVLRQQESAPLPEPQKPVGVDSRITQVLTTPTGAATPSSDDNAWYVPVVTASAVAPVAVPNTTATTVSTPDVTPPHDVRGAADSPSGAGVSVITPDTNPVLAAPVSRAPVPGTGRVLPLRNQAPGVRRTSGTQDDTVPLPAPSAAVVAVMNAPNPQEGKMPVPDPAQTVVVPVVPVASDPVVNPVSPVAVESIPPGETRSVVAPTPVVSPDGVRPVSVVALPLPVPATVVTPVVSGVPDAPSQSVLPVGTSGSVVQPIAPGTAAPAVVAATNIGAPVTPAVTMDTPSVPSARIAEVMAAPAVKPVTLQATEATGNAPVAVVPVTTSGGVAQPITPSTPVLQGATAIPIPAVVADTRIDGTVVAAAVPVPASVPAAVPVQPVPVSVPQTQSVGAPVVSVPASVSVAASGIAAQPVPASVPAAVSGIAAQPVPASVSVAVPVSTPVVSVQPVPASVPQIQSAGVPVVPVPTSVPAAVAVSTPVVVDMPQTQPASVTTPVASIAGVETQVGASRVALPSSPVVQNGGSAIGTAVGTTTPVAQTQTQPAAVAIPAVVSTPAIASVQPVPTPVTPQATNPVVQTPVYETPIQAAAAAVAVPVPMTSVQPVAQVQPVPASIPVSVASTPVVQTPVYETPIQPAPAVVAVPTPVAQVQPVPASIPMPAPVPDRRVPSRATVAPAAAPVQTNQATTGSGMASRMPSAAVAVPTPASAPVVAPVAPPDRIPSIPDARSSGTDTRQSAAPVPAPAAPAVSAAPVRRWQPGQRPTAAREPSAGVGGDGSRPVAGTESSVPQNTPPTTEKGKRS